MAGILATAHQGQDVSGIRALFWEYLQWVNARVGEEFGISFEIASILESDMRDLHMFMPPTGRLLVCLDGDQLAGMACLKYLAPTTGEIKRMYVRPECRKQGIGRALVDRLVEEASQIGYLYLRLDSARFMKDAHHLYRKAGFCETGPYEGSEIPEEYQRYWVFMVMALPARLEKQSTAAIEMT